VRLVLDTNTVISGLLWHDAPAKIDAALAGQIELFTSDALLLELADVLPRAKFNWVDAQKAGRADPKMPANVVSLRRAA
jgi:predicted nucleic acid-binding protein